MARIKNKQIYKADVVVNKEDYLIGSDADQQGQTKNYPIKSILNSIDDFSFAYIYSNGGQINSPIKPINYQSVGRFFTKDNIAGLPDVRGFIFNRYNIYEDDLQNVFKMIRDLQDTLIMRIGRNSNTSTFGYYRVVGVSVNEEFTQINVEPLKGSCYGELTNEKIYFLSSNFTNNLEIEINEDKYYIHDQPTASDTWICNHGLSKKPAVEVHDTAGTKVKGQIDHTSLNQTIIRFNKPFSGEATFN